MTLQHPDYDSNPEEYRLPIGAEIWDLDGHVLYTAEAGCPDLHGDAGNGHMAVFGCTGGVLALEADHGEYEDWFIPAPAGSPDDFRLTSVWGYHDLHHFFALGSSVGLYIVEPEDGFMEQLIPATDSLRPIQVAISHDGELLIVVMRRRRNSFVRRPRRRPAGFHQRDSVGQYRPRLLGPAPHRYGPRPYFHYQLDGRRSHRAGRPRTWRK